MARDMAVVVVLKCPIYLLTLMYVWDLLSVLSSPYSSAVLVVGVVVVRGASNRYSMSKPLF